LSVVVDFERVLERQREQAERAYDLALAREAADDAYREHAIREERYQCLHGLRAELRRGIKPGRLTAEKLDAVVDEAKRDLEEAEMALDLAVATYLRLGGDPREYQ